MRPLDRLAVAGLSSALFAWLVGCGQTEATEPEHVVKPAAPARESVSTPADAVEVPSGLAPEQAKADPGTAAPTTAPKPPAKGGAPAAPEPAAPSGKSPPNAEPAPPKPATPRTAAPAPATPPPTPTPTTPPAPAAPARKTVVRNTAHVRVDVPPGMQSLLDADPRMQPWIDRVMAVADRCYASVRKTNAAASGVIAVEVTMHPNARPDADIKSLPNELAGLVTCGTGELMRNRMPLFTGPEGQRHTLRMHFTP